MKNIVEMCELRKVLFRLDDTEYGCFDHDTDEERERVEEEQKEREGLFHRWGDHIVVDEETGAKLQETIAIVEDSDGKVYELNPRLINRFITEP
ncbi:MAG TPA: hypothetical protein DDZ78_08085 [Porphyromonadaceae bacterium]|nr:hypothetical protein [Porphyromonadaceae bacterium]